MPFLHDVPDSLIFSFWFLTPSNTVPELEVLRVLTRTLLGSIPILSYMMLRELRIGLHYTIVVCIRKHSFICFEYAAAVTP